MRRRVLTAFALLIAMLSFGRARSGSEGATDTTGHHEGVMSTREQLYQAIIVDRIGDRALSTLHGAKRANLVFLTGQLAVEYSADELARFDGVLCDYPIERKGPNLDPLEIEELRSLLLDPYNYTLDSYRCGFKPQYAVTFFTDSDSVTAILSIGCASALFCHATELHGGGVVTTACGTALQELVGRIVVGD